MSALKFDNLPSCHDKQCEILLYRNVTNGEELRQACVDGLLGGGVALVKADLIVDPFQLVVVANKAILAHSGTAENIAKTRSVDTEILYNLSPSKSIADSLKQFGVGSNEDKNLYAVITAENSTQIQEKLVKVKSLIKGELCPADTDTFDADKIAKMHKITDSRQKTDKKFLSDLLISKTAMKDLV